MYTSSQRTLIYTLTSKSNISYTRGWPKNTLRPTLNFNSAPTSPLTTTTGLFAHNYFTPSTRMCTNVLTSLNATHSRSAISRCDWSKINPIPCTTRLVKIRIAAAKAPRAKTRTARRAATSATGAANIKVARILGAKTRAAMPNSAIWKLLQRREKIEGLVWLGPVHPLFATLRPEISTTKTSASSSKISSQILSARCG